MKTRLLALLPVALALMLSGCVTTRHLALADIKAPSLANGVVIKSIGTQASFAAYRDTITSGETVLWTFPTGEIASQIFAGGADAVWQIDRLSSQLTLERKDEMPLPVFSTTARFTISCVVKTRTKQVPLSASGVGETSLDVGLAVRQAVERALLDIEKQASVVAGSGE